MLEEIWQGGDGGAGEIMVELGVHAWESGHFGGSSARGRSKLTRRFQATVSREGCWYVAKCVEVEVASQGETVEEALENLREALELYFENER